MANTPSTSASFTSPDPLAEQELKLTLALDEIRDSVDVGDDPQRMFDDIARLLKSQFDADACGIVLLNESSDDLDGIASVGMVQGAALDLCRAAMEYAQPTAIDNPYFPYTLGNCIMLHNLPLGGLVLARAQSPFTAEQSRLLSIAEKQIDSAIIQARMLSKLLRRNRELEAIYQIDHLRDTISDEAELLKAFAASITAIFDAEYAAVIRADGRRFEHGTVSLPESVIAALPQHAAQMGLPSTVAPHNARGWVFLTAPLTLGGNRLGTVIVGRGALFTEADLRLLHALNSQIDTALMQFRARRATKATAPPARPLWSKSMNGRPPLNDSIRYVNGALHIDSVPASALVQVVGTPAYVYSLRRVLTNLRALQSAFAGIDAHIHYSVKANGNLALLQTLIRAGVGVDAVSAGEIYRALRAGARPDSIVFAGVGKTADELRYAVQQRIGWINIENEAECALLDQFAEETGIHQRVALRVNPDVTAATQAEIATGHHRSKFGLPLDRAAALLRAARRYPHLRFEGLHVHIGSQLEDTTGTLQALAAIIPLARQHRQITTLDLGGGFPVAYDPSSRVPSFAAFARAIKRHVKGYHVMLEPGRSITADAGVLLASVSYLKQLDLAFAILDAGMTELIRPALYDAFHAIVPVQPRRSRLRSYTIAGPVCESTDMWEIPVSLPELKPGDVLAILTAGAYGMVMASNYNARPRPAEVVISEDGAAWRISRRRETWEDLLLDEAERL